MGRQQPPHRWEILPCSSSTALALETHPGKQRKRGSDDRKDEDRTRTGRGQGGARRRASGRCADAGLQHQGGGGTRVPRCRAAGAGRAGQTCEQTGPTGRAAGLVSR